MEHCDNRQRSRKEATCRYIGDNRLSSIFPYLRMSIEKFLCPGTLWNPSHTFAFLHKMSSTLRFDISCPFMLGSRNHADLKEPELDAS